MTFVPQIANSLLKSGTHSKHDDTLDTYVAAPLTKGSATGQGVNQPGRRQEDDVNLVAYSLRRDPGGTGQGHNTNYVTSITLASDPITAENLAQPSTRRNGDPGVVAIGTLREHVRPGSNTDHVIQQEASVRRLTPTECERLQALPDGWTQLGDTADSKRYAALGDAVTSSVTEWIGRRLIAA